MATASQDSIPRHLLTPPGLVLKDSGVGDGTKGVFCLNRVLEGQMYGPYAGEVILEGCDNKVDYRYAWEVYDSSTNELMHIINATKPETGNWMRYVNCARYFEEQNIVSVQIGSEIFYKAIRDIPAGEELLTWFSLSYQMQKKKKKKRKSVDAVEEKETVTAPNKRKKKSSSVSESTPGDDMGTPLLYEIMTADTKLKKPKDTSAVAEEKKKLPKLSKSKSTGSIDLNMLKCNLKKPTTPTKKPQTASSTPIKDLIIAPSTDVPPGINSRKITPKKALKVKDLIAMQDAKNGVSKSDISPSPKKMAIPKLKNLSSTSPKVKGQNKVKADGPPDLALAGMVLHSEHESGKIFQFEIRPEHHAENKLGKKMFSCDICHAPYNHAFSLKRHFLRSHINAKYLPLSDITNCLINVVLQESAVRNCTGNAKWFSKDTNKQPKSLDVDKDQNASAEKTEDGKQKTTMPGVYRCYLCSELYDDLDELKKHTQNHPSQEKMAKKLSCEKCNMTFSGKNNLARHQETHLESKQVCCMVCGKGFNKESNMKKHLQFHLNKNFACGICSEKFSTVAELRKHVRMEHSGSESKMAVQVKQMESGRDKPVRMDPSAMAKKPAKVNIIKKKVMKKKLVAAALASPNSGGVKIGSEQNKDSSTMDPNKPVPCPTCNKRFSSEASMKKHAQFHGNRRFSCRYCKEKFPHPFGLRKHLWSIHTAQMKQNLNRTPGVIRKVPNFHQKKNETFDEKFPEKAGSEKADVEKKMASDIKEEGKPVKQLAAVSESQKASAEKPYSCRVCGKAFPSEANMKMHLQYHFGRTFSCRFCFKKFPHPASLRKHLNAEHPEGMVNGVLIKSKPDIIIGPDGKRLKRKRKKKIKSELELMLRNENPEVKVEKTEVKQERDVDNESTHSQEFESARLEKISQEAEEEDPWEEEIQITKELKKKARLHFACILCKKKFNSYVNMCRHKRLAHRVKKYGMPTVTRQRIAARLQDCVVVNDYIPITPAEFYANIADNIATNLDNYIDGKQEALTNYEKHVRIPDYQSVYSVASEEQPQIDWSKYNFPKSYTPWQGIVGYDIEEDLLSVYDKIGFRDERAARRLRRSRSSSDASFENKETGDENSNLSMPDRKSTEQEEDGALNCIGSSQIKSESQTCENPDLKLELKTEKDGTIISDSRTDKDCNFVPVISGNSVLQVKPSAENCGELIPEFGLVREKDQDVHESEPKPENDCDLLPRSLSKTEQDDSDPEQKTLLEKAPQKSHNEGEDNRTATAQQKCESHAEQQVSRHEDLSQNTTIVNTQIVSLKDTVVPKDTVYDDHSSVVGQPGTERTDDDETVNIQNYHSDKCLNGEVIPYCHIAEEIDYDIEECMNEMIEQCVNSQQKVTDSVPGSGMVVLQDKTSLKEIPQMDIETVKTEVSCAISVPKETDDGELLVKDNTSSTTRPCIEPGEENSSVKDNVKKSLVKEECVQDQQYSMETCCITESITISPEKRSSGAHSPVVTDCNKDTDKCGSDSVSEKSKFDLSIQIGESRRDSSLHLHRSKDAEELVNDSSTGFEELVKDSSSGFEDLVKDSSTGVEDLVKDSSVLKTGEDSSITVDAPAEESGKEQADSSVQADKTRSDSTNSLPCESKENVTNNISISSNPATTETVPITSVPPADATHVIQSDTVSEPSTQDILHSNLPMDMQNKSQPCLCDSLVREEKSCPVFECAESVPGSAKSCTVSRGRTDIDGQGHASECDPQDGGQSDLKDVTQEVENVLDRGQKYLCTSERDPHDGGPSDLKEVTQEVENVLDRGQKYLCTSERDPHDGGLSDLKEVTQEVENVLDRGQKYLCTSERDPHDGGLSDLKDVTQEVENALDRGQKYLCTSERDPHDGGLSDLKEVTQEVENVLDRGQKYLCTSERDPHDGGLSDLKEVTQEVENVLDRGQKYLCTSERDPHDGGLSDLKEVTQEVENVLDRGEKYLCTSEEQNVCLEACNETKTSCHKENLEGDLSETHDASSCEEKTQSVAGDSVQKTDASAQQSYSDNHTEFSAKIGLVKVQQSEKTVSDSPSVASVVGEPDLKLWIRNVVVSNIIQKVFSYSATVPSNDRTVIKEELLERDSAKIIKEGVCSKSEASLDETQSIVKTEPEESAIVDRDIEDAVESILCEVASNNISSDSSPLLEGNNNKITPCMESIKIEIPPVLLPYYEDYEDDQEEDSSQIASQILSDIINKICPVSKETDFSEDEVKFSISGPRDQRGFNNYVMTTYNDHLKSPTSIFRHLQLIRWDKESLASLTVNMSDDEQKEEEIPPQGKVIRFKPNLQLSPVPSASFNTISFGSHGQVNYICGVCKKHFLMTDALLRHHFKKHPSIDFSYIEIENGNDIDLLFYTWPCNYGLLASSQPFSEDCRNLDMFTCTRCGSTFKHIHRLHVHIINCDPKNYETLASKRRKYRRKMRKQMLEAMKSKTNEAGVMPTPVIVEPPRRPGRPRGILGRKKRLDGIIDSPKNRKRRNYELLYNPHNHVRRREMTDVLQKHQCRGCENTFKTLSLLERHAKKCSGRDKLQSLKPVQSSLLEDMAQKPRHTCRYCSKHFTYLKSLANHYRAFCSVRKSRQQKGLLGAEDFQDEEDLLKLIKKLEMAKLESKETDIDENDGRRKRGGWPRGMKRKNRRKRHCWTYVKKRKPDEKDEAEEELVDPMLWNPEVDWMDELLPAGHGEEDDSEEEEEGETHEAVPEEEIIKEEIVNEVKNEKEESGKEDDLDTKQDISTSAKPESPKKLKKKTSNTVKEEATDEAEEPKVLLEDTSPRKNPKRSVSEPAHSEPETTPISPPKKETEHVENIRESEEIGKGEEPETSGNVQDFLGAINVQKSTGQAQGEENILSPVKSEGEIPTTSDGSGTPGSSPEKKKRKYVRKIPLEEVLLKKKKNRMIKLGLIGDGGTASKQTESSLVGTALASPTKKKKGQVVKSEPVKIAPVVSDLKLAQVSDIVMKPALAIKTASPMNMTKNKDVLDGGTVTLITVFPQSKPSVINAPIIQIVNDKPINISPKKTKQDSPPQKTVKQSPNRSIKDSNASEEESPLKTAKIKTPRKNAVQKSPCKAKTKSPKTDASSSDHVETDSVVKATKKTPKKIKRGTAMDNPCADTVNIPSVVKAPNKTPSKKTEISSTCTNTNTESNTTSKGKTTPKKTPAKVKVTPKKGQPESGCSKSGANETGNIKKTPTKCKKGERTGSANQNEPASETDKTTTPGKSQTKKRKSGANSSLMCEEDADFLYDSDDSEEVLSRKRPKPRLKCVIEKTNLVNKVTEFGSESDISR